MNIIQQHERTRFYMDQVRSPRYLPETLNEALNVATLSIINDRYDNIKKMRRAKNYSFQAVQRVRDELYTIVKNSGAIVAAGNYLPIASYPTDYKYMLQSWATIDGTEYRCSPTSYDEDLDYAFKRPQISEPERVYWIESNLGVEILFGDSGTLASGRFWYISIPATVAHGIIRTAAYVYPANTTAICYTSTCVINAVTYTIGQTITVLAAQTLTAGQAVDGYTNSDLPDTLHDEICRRAAEQLSGTAENYNKMQVLDRNVEKA